MEARRIAELTNAVRNRIAKFIQEESKEGKTRLDFGTWGLCDTQVNNLKEELSELGYDVTYQKDTDELIIKW